MIYQCGAYTDIAITSRAVGSVYSKDSLRELGNIKISGYNQTKVFEVISYRKLIDARLLFQMLNARMTSNDWNVFLVAQMTSAKRRSSTKSRKRWDAYKDA